MSDSPSRPAFVTGPPDDAEMALRLERVRARMAAEDLDAYVVHCPDNVYYLTNFANYIHERPFVLVIRPTGPLQFIVPLLEEEHVRVRSVGAVITTATEEADLRALNDLVAASIECPVAPWSVRDVESLGDVEGGDDHVHPTATGVVELLTNLAAVADQACRPPA